MLRIKPALTLLLWLLSGWAAAITSPLEADNRATETARLELIGESGSRQPALLQQTKVHFEIAGLLVRTRVSQTFRNDGSDWVEGVYSYPLPEQAAVDRLRMRIGERLIEGEIQERQQARKTYQQAKQSGQRTSLIEQQRPNIFTTSVANIGPGETITIEIEYQQQARYDSGDFRLRFPMVILPRYIPGQPLSPMNPDDDHHGDLPQLSESAPIQLNGDGFGWAAPTDQVPDAPLITPPVADPGQSLPNRVRISAHLNAGFELAKVRSSYHGIELESLGPTEAKIRLSDTQVKADRDFELVWTPTPSQAPQAALLSHQQGDQHYGLLMLVPPTANAEQPLPRAVTLILDISGSMHGDSIAQARQSLLRAIDDLSSQDRFNLILFNNSSYALFNQPQPANDHYRSKARRLVAGVEANGGTEMAGAIRQALSQSPQPGYVEQVLFITDGAVGNEDALFNLIEQQLGQRRLFTIGIGSAPNSHFMTKAAQLGRGTFTYIGASHEVEQKMTTLLDKLRAPLLTDLKLDADQALQSYPARIPDLYRGEPLILSYRADQPPKQLQLSGRIGDQHWQQTIQLQSNGNNPAVPVLWGRARIAELMDQHRRAAPGEPRRQLRQQIVDTALAHQLVSKFTSLVAVDKTPARPSQSSLKTQVEKTELAKGISHQKIFGMAKTATPAQRQILIGLALLLAALLLALFQQRQQGRRHSSNEALPC
ncbi:marine proteobacterial sortase target protein [Motiliproteus sp.]|uniref:marine proteobacterial sortase target protein n=1 Tax=Motiliproteus sp. TaxID=1898955 RepID=UPI003BA87482